MKKKIAILVFVTLLLIGAVVVSTWYVKTLDIAVLDAKGMIGIKEGDLINTAFYLMMIIVVPVLILALLFAWIYRESNKKARHAPDWEHNYIAECCCWGVPIIIIIALAVIAYRSSHELNPFAPIDTGQKPLTIQVVALQWKWLFLYPEQNIAMVNFVQFPENTPIQFEITSDAPMNSFWIPKLGGQIYAMPGMRSKLHLIANEAGKFRGVSANISGDGFAGMTFTAQASSQADFDTWVQSMRQSPQALTESSYEQLVEPTCYDPVRGYVLAKNDLFEYVLMKYSQ